MNNFCVLRTVDGRVLVVDPSIGLQASLINKKWILRNMFGLADELALVADPNEAERLYKQAREAVAANPIIDASDFYRTTYGGLNVSLSSGTIDPLTDPSD